jgi:hypothetical protein
MNAFRRPVRSEKAPVKGWLKLLRKPNKESTTPIMSSGVNANSMTPRETDPPTNPGKAT